MKRDIGEELLRTWLELAAAIWSRQMVSGMTYNEAVVSNRCCISSRKTRKHL